MFTQHEIKVKKFFLYCILLGCERSLYFFNILKCWVTLILVIKSN